MWLAARASLEKLLKNVTGTDYINENCCMGIAANTQRTTETIDIGS